MHRQIWQLYKMTFTASFRELS